MNRKCLIACAVLAILLVTQIAGAWNARGHMLVSLVAWGQLQPDVRDTVVAILKKHPRFKQDFLGKMPNNIKNKSQAVKDKWIFIHASTWPDIARGFKDDTKKRYHHGTWHYINYPLFISPQDAQAIGDKIPANLDVEWKSGMRSSRMNIMQALNKADNRLRSDKTSKREKAVYYCWMLHLSGDLHQPLHSTALFTSARFPGGDHGGNSIPTEGSKNNLHKVWDGLLGGGKALSTMEPQVVELLAIAGMRDVGEEAAVFMDFAEWYDESYDLAADKVYSPDILDEVRVKEDDLGDALEKAKLSDDYKTQAETAAQQRIVEAGYRLAEYLNLLLGSDE